MPTRGRRPLTEQDRAEWARYAQSVAPLPGRAPIAPPPAPDTPPAPPPAPRLRAPAQRLPPAIIGTQPAGVDTGTWQRFRTGKLPVSRTLDLHGRTAQRAFHAVAHFVQSAHAERLRCVEIITGRGPGELGGVLQRELPFWLNSSELRPYVLAAAHPHPANPGSVRVLLRRARRKTG